MRSWLSNRRVLGLLQFPHEQCQRPIQNRRDIAARNAVPQQVLCESQLVVRVPRGRELDLVILRRERLHLGAGRLTRRHDVSLAYQPIWFRGGRDRRRRRHRYSDRSRHRQFPNRCRHGRLWAQSRDEVLDVLLALMACGRENSRVIVIRQVRSQETDGGQMQGAISQRIQD